MINLAGKTKADLNILEELNEADIQIIEGERSRGEVPYTLSGKLGSWTFKRAWYYWMASASDGLGLPFNIATELHERKYPLVGENKPKIYGHTIRVVGHAGCPHPREWVNGKGGIDNYHIDDQEGLNALAKTIRDLNNLPSNMNNSGHLLHLYDKIFRLYSKWEPFETQEGVEWLKKMPEILYSNENTIKELAVAIKDENEVVSIAKRWENKQGLGGIAQYFFEGNRITGFNRGHMSGPGDILNRGPEIDLLLRPHYEEIKEIRPRAALSLEKCMRRLEIPGPDYTGQSYESLTAGLR